MRVSIEGAGGEVSSSHLGFDNDIAQKKYTHINKVKKILT